MFRKYNLLVKEGHEMVILGMGGLEKAFFISGSWKYHFLVRGIFFGVGWIELLVQGSSFGYFWDGVQVLDIFE